jgi:cell wall assembly regulator SMI1
MQTIRDLVNDVVGFLTLMNRPVVSILQARADALAINEAFGTLGLVAPKDLLDMFTTHNGTKVIVGDSLDDIHFFPGFYWMSLEDCVSSYKAVSNHELWEKSWFPLFSNGGGDFYCLVCDVQSSNYGQIVGFIYGDSYDVEFSSLQMMLAVLKECYLRNIYYVEGGYLEADDYAAIEVAKEFCPELDLYK